MLAVEFKESGAEKGTRPVMRFAHVGVFAVRRHHVSRVVKTSLTQWIQQDVQAKPACSLYMRVVNEYVYCMLPAPRVSDSNLYNDQHAKVYKSYFKCSMIQSICSNICMLPKVYLFNWSAYNYTGQS